MKSIIPPNWFSLLCDRDDTMKKKRNGRRKDAIINNFMFQSAYLSRGGGRIKKKSGTGKKNGAGRSNRLQIALLFFFFFLYHEMLPIIMKRVNWILFFFFFHLSNNWFDISEHFKGSLARRRRSKLQYKAEDLPLAECQVYARALASPSPSIFLPLLPSSPLSPSLSSLPKPSEILVKLYTTCLRRPCLCVFVCALCPGPARFIVTL